MTGAPEIHHIDFSQFHDLMHWPFTAYCRAQYPGGWGAGWHHIQMAWEHKHSDTLRAATWCRWLHRHRPQQVWRGRGKNATSWISCADCGMRKPA